jgi:hypothetical protein
MFIFDPAHIQTYNLDFIAIAMTIFFELIVLLLRVYSYCKLNGSNGGLIQNEGSETPQENKASIVKEKQIPTVKKQNSYAVNLDDSLA